MTAPAPARLDDQDEVLYRQVHPDFAKGEVVSKTAFLPTKAEDLMLSTLRGHVGPESAYDRWRAQKGETVGSYGITVAEVDGTQIKDANSDDVFALYAVDDAATQGDDHASVVFTTLPSKGKREQAARKLRDHAVARGCLHP